MKTVLLFLCFFTAFLTAQDMPVTTAELFEYSHDFGEVKEGDKVNCVVKIKNTGVNPLIIQNVRPSKGYITPDWAKEEILPGQEGFIQVEVDTKGKSGNIKGSVTIISNNQSGNITFSFTANVESDFN